MTTRIENRDGKLFLVAYATATTGPASYELPPFRELADSLGIVPTKEEIYGEAYDVSLSPERFEEGANWILVRLGLSAKEEPKSDPDEMAGWRLIDLEKDRQRADDQMSFDGITWRDWPNAVQGQCYKCRWSNDPKIKYRRRLEASDTPTADQSSASAEVLEEKVDREFDDAWKRAGKEKPDAGTPWEEAGDAIRKIGVYSSRCTDIIQAACDKCTQPLTKSLNEMQQEKDAITYERDTLAKSFQTANARIVEIESNIALSEEFEKAQKLSVARKEIDELRQKVQQLEATHEKEMLAVIDEREEAGQAASHMYFLVLGRSPEWSNLFGYDQAYEEISDAVNALKAEITRLREVPAGLPTDEEIERSHDHHTDPTKAHIIHCVKLFRDRAASLVRSKDEEIARLKELMAKNADGFSALTNQREELQIEIEKLKSQSVSREVGEKGLNKLVDILPKEMVAILASILRYELSTTEPEREVKECAETATAAEVDSITIGASPRDPSPTPGSNAPKGSTPKEAQ